MEICVLFAVPGAGKSRTVAEIASQTVGTEFYKRMKVNDDVLAGRFRAIGQQHEEAFKQASYRRVMDWLVPVAQDYLKEQYQGSKLKVLHFDEVQKLMGNCMISERNYETKRGEAEFRDLFMPAFCEALDRFSADPNNPRVVLSGTNFFSPLQFNPGSTMKVKHLHLPGRFPSRWVMDELIHKYFDFSDVLENDQVLKSEFEQVIHYLSANRRVVQYFLEELRSIVIKLDTKLDADTLSKHVKYCSKKAVGHWTWNCMNCTGASCMVSLALCLYPEGFQGQRGQIPSKFPQEYISQDSEIDVVLIPRGTLPSEVKEYANAGGLNIWRRGKYKDAVEVPVGCLRHHLLRKCNGLSSEENSQAIQAIAQYTEKFDPETKGHFFKRGFAFELTTFGSQIGNLVCETLSNAQRKMMIDGRIFANDWVITTSIIDEWKEGRMHCVFEDYMQTGERIVNVGFPVVNVSSVQQDVWRAYGQLKNGYEPGELWKLCNKFLEDITPYLVGTNSCAIFIGSRAFLQAKLQPGAEASEAKKAVTESSLYGDCFFILDGDSLKSKESRNFLTPFDRD